MSAVEGKPALPSGRDYAAGKLNRANLHQRASSKNCSNKPRSSSGGPSRPSDITGSPYPLPTKDGGVLRTVGDAHAYIMALSKKRALRAHWQHAGRLMRQQANVAALTRQFHVALFMDGKLNAGAFEHMTSVRRWRRHAGFANR
jgi:hypothetical protein